MKTPEFTVHWTSALSGSNLSTACSTKKQALKECKALYTEGAKNIRLSQFKPGIGAIDIDWRAAKRI